MKPRYLILSALLSASVGLPLVAAVASDSRSSVRDASQGDPWLAALPQNDRLWVQVTQPTSIEQLSLALRMDESRLARLNDVDEDHQFALGEWLAVPAQGKAHLRQIASINSQELRNSPPLRQPPPVSASGEVRWGDTLVKIAQRYGMTLTELLKLNPGLETARLVVGTQIRLAQSSPVRTHRLLGLAPVGSGGLSWPELPSFEGQGRPPRGVDPSGSYSWPARGVFTSGYGWRWGRMHKGIDIANNVGTPIVAAREGRVSVAGWNDGGYGYLVEVIHPDGSMTRYGHNSRLLVKEGDVVTQGQPISLMGSTGRSTGPHLHFEIHPAGEGAVNPLRFLPPRA